MLPIRTVVTVIVASLVISVASTAAVVSSASLADDAATAHDSAVRVGNAQLVVQPPPPPQPASVDPSVEAIALANAERAAAGLAPLVLHPAVQQAALAHSRDQAAHDTMSHIGSNGSTVGDRLTAAGYAWTTYGENVAAGQPTAADAIDAWLASAGHRRNILDPAFVHTGVAVAYSSDGRAYWTMVFAA